MAYGLQVFDSSGNLEIDFSSRHANLYGVYSISSYVSTQPFSVAPYTYPPPLTLTIPIDYILADGTFHICNTNGNIKYKIYNGYITAVLWTIPYTYDYSLYTYIEYIYNTGADPTFYICRY